MEPTILNCDWIIVGDMLPSKMGGIVIMTLHSKSNQLHEKSEIYAFRNLVLGPMLLDVSMVGADICKI